MQPRLTVFHSFIGLDGLILSINYKTFQKFHFSGQIKVRVNTPRGILIQLYRVIPWGLITGSFNPSKTCFYHYFISIFLQFLKIRPQKQMDHIIDDQTCFRHIQKMSVCLSLGNFGIVYVVCSLCPASCLHQLMLRPRIFIISTEFSSS